MKSTTPAGADLAALAKLAQALNFICGADDPATIAMKKAASTGNAEDVKKARALFSRLKPGSQQAALNLMEE